MAYEALYRRYRPSKFSDVFGQSHVVAALRNAVESDRVGHAYLFSGPRGTGKTSSARILAKALNCTNLQGGEPCDECDSCQAFQTNSSYDLHELDAASNNGVDAMRDLIGKVALGSPGRTKVYILDEVHMLSSGAENALLKTLEEPPPHVVFVLATTEPNKVVPTIRSRTQHLEFGLLSGDEVVALVDYVANDAGLSLTDDDRAYVVRAGGGSARDTLSALDQVVAAGGAPQAAAHLDQLFGALAARDTATALMAIEGAVQSGRDPSMIATSLLQDLRSVFLVAMNADVSHLPESEKTAAHERAQLLRPAQITRAIEVIGTSIIDMRQAPDPRVDLDVAVVRLTRPDLDVTPEALLERIERLESGAPAAPASPPAAAPVMSDTGSDTAAQNPQPAAAVPPAEQPPAAAPVSDTVSDTAPPQGAAPPQAAAPPAGGAPSSAGKRGADMVRAKLAEQAAARGQAPPPQAAPSAPVAPAVAEPPPAPAGSSKSLADVQRERAAQSTDQPPATPPSAAASEPAAPPAEPPPVEAEPAPSEPAAPIAQPAPGEAPAQAAEQPQPTAAPSAAPAGDLPTIEQIRAAWNDTVLQSMSGRVRSRFTAGHFVGIDNGTVQFGLPNPVHRDRCDEIRAEVDDALQQHFGMPIPLTLIVDAADVEPDLFDAPPSQGDDQAAAVAALPPEESIDPNELVDAPDQGQTGVDRLLATFEGSTVLDEDPSE